MNRLALPIAAALLLGACSQGEGPATERTGAAGEVLEGTISDAMIPYHELRSQPPLEAAAPSDSPGTPGSVPSPREAGSDEDAGASETAPAATAPATSPAASPSPAG